MPTPRELAQQIAQRIVCRTHGRVRHVSVQLDGERIVLHGDATTYYAKQLARHAALEILNGRTLINAIEVI
jgi:BON domain